MNKGKIILTGFGERIREGLSPKTLSYLNKIVTYEEFKNIILELGSSNKAILSFKEIKFKTLLESGFNCLN